MLTLLLAALAIDPQLLRDDFRIARQALEEGHSGIYRYTKKSDLDRVFDRAEKKIDHAMDPLEFYRLMAPVVGMIKCGHTSVLPPATIQHEMNTTVPLFPFDVEVMNRKVYILRDYTANKLAGEEIRAINGVSARKILAVMMAATPADGNIQTARAYRIGHAGAFPRLLYSLLDIRSPFTLTLARRRVEVPGIERSRLPPRPPPPATAADFRFVDEGRTALLTVRGFGGFADAGRKKRLNVFFPEVFESIAKQGSRALIIDVRNNSGGEDALGKQLFSFLIEQPFQYYQDLVINKLVYSFSQYSQPPAEIPPSVVEQQPNGKYRAVKHPNWGLQQPSRPTFRGPVFILVNGGSFSTTCEFLSAVVHHKRATLIGEEPAGGYYGNSSGFMPNVTLPNSKLVLRVPLMTYYLAVNRKGRPDRSVFPDYPVHYTIQERVARVDKEMDLALSLARKHWR